MTAHYNIALYPQSADLARSLCSLAQDNLSGKSEKYLLGEEAIPHISLCQFVSPSENIHEIWLACKDLGTGPLSISFSHIYIKAGVGALHQGKNWVGLYVMPSVALIDLQKSVFGRLEKNGIESATNRLRYFPHLTLGRLDQASVITISRLPDASFWEKSYEFDLSLGRSDQYGVYLERLY